jgi:Archaeal/vacuolar-type H+-ATPase subunit C
VSSAAAYISSVSRLFKAKTLSRGLVNELLSSKDWKEFMSVLKERGFVSEVPDSITVAELMLKKRALSLLEQLRDLSVSVKLAKDIVSAYVYRVTLDELTYLTSIVWNKLQGDVKLLTTLRSHIDQMPASMEELQSMLKGTIYGDALSFASSKSPKDLSQLNSLLEYYYIHFLSNIVEGLKGDWKAAANNILCGYKDYYSLSLAARQKISMDVRCNVSEDDIRDMANSRSQEDVINVLRRTVYSKSIDFTNMYTALTSLYRLAINRARTGAVSIFMGSPFNPVVAMGAAELIKLDTEDVIRMINGLKLRVPLDRLKQSLSFELL